MSVERADRRQERDVRGMSDEEIGRLANRLAMLVSDDGEADNAGRAVGALARRLGLSGGQLKAIFMAGMESAGVQASKLAEQETRMHALAEELDQTRAQLRRAEAAAHSAQRERDALRGEAEQLHNMLDRRRTSAQVRIAVGVVVLAGLIGGGWFAIFGPESHQVDRQQRADESPFYRNGVVHERNVALHSQPDTAAPTLAVLTEGMQVVVHRTLWHNLQQWVEVEVNGQTGYVLSTEVNLS
jgi:hypothetical protein